MRRPVKDNPVDPDRRSRRRHGSRDNLVKTRFGYGAVLNHDCDALRPPVAWPSEHGLNVNAYRHTHNQNGMDGFGP